MSSALLKKKKLQTKNYWKKLKPNYFTARAKDRALHTHFTIHFAYRFRDGAHKFLYETR